MNCRTAKKFLMARVDEGLPAQAEVELQSHLGVCPGCRDHAAETKLTMEWLRDLPEAQPSENFDWRLRLRLSQLERESQNPATGTVPRPHRQRWTMQFAASAAAAAVLVVALGFMVLKQPVGIEPESRPVTSVQPRTQDIAGQGRLPNLAPRERWLRIVPTSAGAPLGPDPRQPAAPSILGEAPPESIRVIP